MVVDTVTDLKYNSMAPRPCVEQLDLDYEKQLFTNLSYRQETRVLLEARIRSALSVSPSCVGIGTTS